jgi:hypothetical protein
MKKEQASKENENFETDFVSAGSTQYRNKSFDTDSQSESQKHSTSQNNEKKEEVKMTKEEVLASLKKRALEQGGTNFLRFEVGEQRVLYIVGEDNEKFLSPVWVVKDLETGESLYLSQYGYLKSRVEIGKAYFIEYEGESEIKQGKFKGKKARLFRVTELTKADLSAFDTEDIPF